jgi:phosphotransferase system enzyme I (PtsI)
MRYKGKSVMRGVSIGRLHVFKKRENIVKRQHVEDTDSEIERYEKARDTAIDQLKILYDKALKEVGEANAQIFDVHQMLLQDLDYNESIKNIISSQMVNAEYAVAATGDNFAEIFSQMDDDYMRARSADIKDISNRVVAVLQGCDEDNAFSLEPSILLADDLAPSETVQLDKNMVLSFVTRKGSTNSHTAILARTMSIPALIGVDFPDDVNGKMGIVDGYDGELIVDPTEEELKKYKDIQAKDEEKARLLQELKGKENITKSGKKIKLYANIGGVKDVADVLKNDAGGIGLFRSEFLYLGRDDYPSEEDQFNAYKTVAEMMAGKKVIIRTLDIGADKQADYFKLAKEDNPALGFRAIRICLTRPEVFKTQLRAIFRASYYGNIGIMYPMIISVDEIKKIKEIVEEVKHELDEAGIPYGEVEQGVMIETPAAVIMSEELAKEVDFFSIGTNDLTQYTLACDRQNAQLEEFVDTHHPAVLREIEYTIKNGHKGGAWVGICGELAADTGLTEKFLEMGVDELSVTPSRVLPVREAIRNAEI